jgi:hypothetical protein
MVNAAMLAGHIAAPARAGAVQHNGEIADTSQRGQAGSGIAAIAAALIVADRRARLEMVGGKTDTAIPDAVIDDDPACPRQDP